MDAECAPTRRDIREQLVHLGVSADQRGELVHDHDESRQRPRGLVHISGIVSGEDAFSAPDLGSQALDRPHGRTVIEIGDDAGDVRKNGEGVEGAAALEVDEKKTDLPDISTATQAGRPRDEQLALAGAGHAHHDGVGSVGHEVDGDDLSCAHTDGGAQSRAGATADELLEPHGSVAAVAQLTRAFRQHRRDLGCLHR